jgi:deoxyribose-phosphate aldolase
MKRPIASYIDYTLLKAACTTAEIKKLCEEAVEYHFAAVCIPPYVVKDAVHYLSGQAVKTATVIGFLMGYSSIESKKAESVQVMDDGADELDVVINLIALKNGEWGYLETEIRELVSVIHEKGKVIKVIVESGILTSDELIHCCHIYGKQAVDYMKTSTGYAEKGASLSDIATMRQYLPPEVQIKASGGIRHYKFAEELIASGANRLGCSSGIQILEEEKKALAFEKTL